MPSLRVLPVPWDSLYPRLYQSKAFPLFRCNMLDGVHFPPQIPGEIALSFGSSRESGQTDGGTRTGGDQMDWTFPRVFMWEKKDPKEDGWSRLRKYQGTFLWQETEVLLEGHFPVRFPAPHPSPHTWRTGSAPGHCTSERLVCLWSGQWHFPPTCFPRKSYLSSYFFISSPQQLVNQRTGGRKKISLPFFSMNESSWSPPIYWGL